MSWGALARVQRRRNPEGTIKLVGFPHGLNTSVPPQRIAQTEASKLINWEIRSGGKLVTRFPITQYTSSATASNAQVNTITEVNIGGTLYTFLVDANYLLDYLDSNPAPVNIGTLEGDAQIIAYNGVAVILDGSYIKYCDDVSEIKIAYDAGDGTTGFQFDNSSLDNDTSLALGNGSNSRIAQKFTSQSWDSGYTIPPIEVTAYLSENGTASATAITVNIRKVSDDSAIATATLVSDATDVAATATQYSATLTVTTEMDPSTDYYLSLEHTGGDASNYIKVHCNTITSGGEAYYYNASWFSDATKDCLMSLSPGRPPKGSFGAIRKSRLHVAGDPDNPGYVWYCNLTHLDWSTSDGGGYFGAVDDNANNFEVGGLAELYGDLYIYGTQSQPYLSKLTGDDPSAYDQDRLFQRPWSTPKTCISVVNDIWAGSGDGAGVLTGVTEYGDLRAFGASGPIKDRIDDYWSTSTAFAGYYPSAGQYWLVMPSYHRVLVAHTKLPIMAPERGQTRYPWTEYEFYRADLTDTDTYKWTASGSGTNEYYVELLGGGDPGFDAQPDFIALDGTKITEGTMGSLNDHEWDYGDNDSLGYSTVYFRDESGDPDTSGVSIKSVLLPTALEQAGSDFLIGGSDGYVWKIDTSDYKDNSEVQIRPIINSAYLEIPMGWGTASKIHLLATSKGGGQIDIEFYTDGRQATQQTHKIITLPPYDTLTVGDMTMDVEDALFTIGLDQDRLFRKVNFDFHSVMLSFTDITISGYPIYFTGAYLKYRGLSF